MELYTAHAQMLMFGYPLQAIVQCYPDPETMEVRQALNFIYEGARPIPVENQ